MGSIPLFAPPFAVDEAKGRRPRLASKFVYIGQRPGMSGSGRDESRPYVPDGGHLLPLLPAPGEKCGLGVTKPKCLIKSSLAPLAPGPPRIGKVQCSGSTHEAFGAHSSTGRRKPRTNEARKLPNKPNFVEPKENQRFTVGFEYGGAVGSVKSDGSDQPGTRVALPRGGRPRGATGWQSL